MIKPLAKGLARPLAARAVEWAARASARPLAVALVYHGTSAGPRPRAEQVVPALPAATLALHLRLLRARYDVVPAARLREAAAQRRRGGRIPVAITFDDDLREHLDVAAPVLLEHGVPATFFLTGIGLGGEAFWWQSLQAALDRGIDLAPLAARFGLALEPLEGLVRGIEALAPDDRRRLSAQLEVLAGEDDERRALNADEIARLAGHGFTVGFHTRGHDRMTELDDEALAAALRDGRDELGAIVGEPLRAIAYPHGAADARVAAAADEAGFELGFVTAMRAITPATPNLLLARPEIHAPTASRFALELARIYAGALRARTASNSS
jgi:peptidoglycan/xylan/chitin deacetylase (PgdA/CDA1 family)